MRKVQLHGLWQIFFTRVLSRVWIRYLLYENCFYINILRFYKNLLCLFHVLLKWISWQSCGWNWVQYNIWYDSVTLSSYYSKSNYRYPTSNKLTTCNNISNLICWYRKHFDHHHKYLWDHFLLEILSLKTHIFFTQHFSECGKTINETAPMLKTPSSNEEGFYYGVLTETETTKDTLPLLMG